MTLHWVCHDANNSHKLFTSSSKNIISGFFLGGGGGGDVDVCKECMRASVQGFIAFNEILDTFKDKKRQIQL